MTVLRPVGMGSKYRSWRDEPFNGCVTMTGRTRVTHVARVTRTRVFGLGCPFYLKKLVIWTDFWPRDPPARILFFFFPASKRVESFYFMSPFVRFYFRGRRNMGSLCWCVDVHFPNDGGNILHSRRS